MIEKQNIVGRYAPSPTGDLHLGNLRTALLAWLHARVHGGEFLMRMEDIDTPRVVAGSDKKLLSDLEWLGLDWDGEVVYQSKRLLVYRDVLADLDKRGLIYPCFCSRKDIRQASSAPHSIPGVYPGTCAHLDPVQINELSGIKAPATRVRVSEHLKQNCGDFVLHRADGLVAYQLAVVVDDVTQGVTDVVRGSDLADSTARQQYLAQLIDRQRATSELHYHHVPLMVDEDGNRMSKRDGSFSAEQWRDSGRSAPQLVAYLANSLNLVDKPDALTTNELLSSIELKDLADVFI